MLLADQSDDGGFRRFRLPQSVSQADLSDNENPLETALGGDFSQKVLLSLQDTYYLDSTGVAWLMTCEKRFRNNQGAMVLHSLHPHATKVLEVLKLTNWFTVAANEQEAEQKIHSRN